jgi:hypothetical protein
VSTKKPDNFTIKQKFTTLENKKKNDKIKMRKQPSHPLRDSPTASSFKATKQRKQM